MKRRFFSLLSLLAIGCAGGGAKDASSPAPTRTDAPIALAHEVCGPAAPSDPKIPSDGGALVEICHDVYVDGATNAEERTAIARDYAEAWSLATAAFSGMQSEPPIAILCKSDPCALEFVGPSRRSRTFRAPYHVPGSNVIVPRNAIVIVRVDEVAKNVMVHEMAHAELAVRLGPGHVPAWIDEGIAVSFSGEPHCEEAAPRGIDDLRRLDDYRAFGEYTDVPGRLVPTYCQAAAEVRAWVAQRDRAQLLALVQKVHDGASFYDAYGTMAAQTTSATPSDAVFARTLFLSSASFGTVNLAGTEESYAFVSNATDIADRNRPFTIAFFVKPRANAGVLAHVSVEADAGWCEPFIGHDRDGRIVAQLIKEPKNTPASFAVATAPKAAPLGEWTHVAMTWAPGGKNRLFIDGENVAEAPAPTYASAGLGAAMRITWGGDRHRTCWPGAIAGGPFNGSMANMNVIGVELSGAEIKKLASEKPR